MEDKDVKNRLRSLRKWMEEEDFDAFIVPTTDPHNNEYTPDYWKARAWLTGFDGSAGTLVLTQEEAALWTDSRYFLQAAEQLKGTSIVLMKDGEDGTPSIRQWLDGKIGEGQKLGLPADMMTIEMAGAMELDEEEPDSFSIEYSSSDPFESIWEGRPELPADPLEIMPAEVAGLTIQEKLRRVFDEQSAKTKPQSEFVMFNDLSEIAWILNLRGNDIEFNPLFVSYLLLGRNRATLFTDERHITPEVKAYLAQAGVTTSRYKGWKHALGGLTIRQGVSFAPTMNLRVVEFCKENRINFAIVPPVVPMMRAVKNESEQHGFRTAMERDGRAMVRFLKWLEEAVPAGNETEMSIDKKLTALRAEEPGFKGLSFGTIAGYAAHGAIVHYEATPETDAQLLPKGLLLLDSGAQYDCGTTDITRTIALGPLTEEERKVYTLVLKGHIGLSSVCFPRGTKGIQLDLAARSAMWKCGYDFGHGTGHGVGSRLCVHEGPQQIRKNLRACTVVDFREGMTITDEPGIYVEGRFGVRIENTLLTVADKTTPFGTFLKFEPLTLCPIGLEPVIMDMLTEEEKEWIDNYHATVRERLLPLLDDEADREFPIRKTEKIRA